MTNGKLKRDEILRIRAWRSIGVPRSRLAFAFHVSENTIKNIDAGKTWTDVTGSARLEYGAFGGDFQRLQAAGRTRKK